MINFVEMLVSRKVIMKQLEIGLLNYRPLMVVFWCLLCCGRGVYAQDLIVTKSGDSINVNILHKTVHYIQYEKITHNNQAIRPQTYTIPRSMVASYQKNHFSNYRLGVDNFRFRGKNNTFSIGVQGGASFLIDHTLSRNPTASYPTNFYTGNTLGLNLKYYRGRFGYGLQYDYYRNRSYAPEETAYYIDINDLRFSRLRQLYKYDDLHFFAPTVAVRIPEEVTRLDLLYHLQASLGYLRQNSTIGSRSDQFYYQSDAFAFSLQAAVGVDIAERGHFSIGLQSMLAHTSEIRVRNGNRELDTSLEPNSEEGWTYFRIGFFFSIDIFI